MNITIVRHGQTNYNLERKLQGITDNLLNATGEQQAWDTKQRLESESIDFIICSPLIRAKQTADIINKGRNVPIQYDERLIERNFGEYEGTYIKDYNVDEFWSYQQNRKYQKAENIKDFLTRVYAFLEEIQNKYQDKNILLVAHAGISVAVECYFKGIPKDDKLVEIRLKNCEYRKYQLKNKGDLNEN